MPVDVDVTSKPDVIAAWRRGRFGNRPQSWSSVVDCFASGFSGLVNVRSRVPNSPHCRYYIRVERLPGVVGELYAAGAKSADLYCNEAMPDADLSLQGEAWRSTEGLYLHYSTAPLPMRDALRDCGRQAFRSEAMVLLRIHLDPASLEDLIELMDEFDAVVEFSAYTRSVGCIPNRNTVIWEVRRY